MSLIISGTDGVTFNDSSLQGAAASPFGLKNRIINGAMQVWQRGTSYSGNPSLTNVAYGSADRWCFYSSSTMATSQSSSVPSGFQYSLKVQRPASATTTNALYAFQVVETNNMVDLANQSVTLSFWAKAGANFSASGNILNVFVNTGTVADQGSAIGLGGWTGFASPISTTQAITTTWTRYTFTGTVASNALELDVGMYFTPTGTAGADDSIYITGVQLEVGSTASNLFLANYPDALLYATLAEAEPYLMNDARIATWSALYDRAIANIKTSDLGQTYPYTSLSVTPR